MALNEAGQSAPRTQLDEHTIGDQHEPPGSIGEPDGFAQVLHPIVRIGGLCLCYPVSGEVRDESRLGRVQSYFPDDLAELIQYGVHKH